MLFAMLCCALNDHYMILCLKWYTMQDIQQESCSAFVTWVAVVVQMSPPSLVAQMSGTHISDPRHYEKNDLVYAMDCSYSAYQVRVDALERTARVGATWGQGSSDLVLKDSTL
jgi:hypothetical protein